MDLPRNNWDKRLEISRKITVAKNSSIYYMAVSIGKSPGKYCDLCCRLN